MLLPLLRRLFFLIKKKPPFIVRYFLETNSTVLWNIKNEIVKPSENRKLLTRGTWHIDYVTRVFCIKWVFGFVGLERRPHCNISGIDRIQTAGQVGLFSYKISYSTFYTLRLCGGWDLIEMKKKKKTKKNFQCGFHRYDVLFDHSIPCARRSMRALSQFSAIYKKTIEF